MASAAGVLPGAVPSYPTTGDWNASPAVDADRDGSGYTLKCARPVHHGRPARGPRRRRQEVADD
jgi:hypothetical protein